MYSTAGLNGPKTLGPARQA